MKNRLLRLGAFFLVACSSSQDEPSATPPVDAGADTHVDAPDAGGTPDAAAGIDLPIAPDYQPLADAIEAERNELQVPGVAVAMMRDGELVFAHGFGTKGPKSTDPITSNTLFRIASMTKALTATAVMHEIDEKKLALDASVTSVLPALAIDGPELPSVTLKNLLTHQSGLFDYLDVDTPAAQKNDGALASYLESDGFRQHEYFMVKPGLFYNYANPNFFIAGRMLEKAAGVSYREAMRTRVFEPLGMSRTFFTPAEVLADGDFTNAIGAWPTGQTAAEIKPDSYENTWGRPCGYGFTSVRQYMRFVKFLADGNPAVLSKESHDAMTTGQVSTRELGDVLKYGYGVEVADGFFLGNDFFGSKLIFHDGALPGFSTEFDLVPQSGFALVVFANRDNVRFSKSLLMALRSFAHLTTTAPSPLHAPSAAALDKVVGTYVDPHLVGTIVIARDGTGLSVSLPDLDAHQIPYDKKAVVASDDAFYLTIQGTPFFAQVHREPNGDVRYVYTRYFVAEREATVPVGDAGVDDSGVGDAGAIDGAAPQNRRNWFAFDRARVTRLLRSAPPSPLVTPPAVLRELRSRAR